MFICVYSVTDSVFVIVRPFFPSEEIVPSAKAATLCRYLNIQLTTPISRSVLFVSLANANTSRVPMSLFLPRNHHIISHPTLTRLLTPLILRLSRQRPSLTHPPRLQFSAPATHATDGLQHERCSMLMQTVNSAASERALSACVNAIPWLVLALSLKGDSMGTRAHNERSALVAQSRVLPTLASKSRGALTAFTVNLRDLLPIQWHLNGHSIK